jgi:fibronectin type 3 domain-containing protein
MKKNKTKIKLSFPSEKTTYRIERSTDGVNFKTIAEASKKSFTDRRLRASSVYYYRLTAI